MRSSYLQSQLRCRKVRAVQVLTIPTITDPREEIFFDLMQTKRFFNVQDELGWLEQDARKPKGLCGSMIEGFLE